MKVLFLSPWYPHPDDPMDGLFVRKHAAAVVRFAQVCVLYMRAKEGISDFEVVQQETDGVHEVYVFFPFTDLGPLRQITKCINYLRAFRRGMRTVEASFGRPDVAQVNVLTRCGVLAWWLKKTRGVPYVIVEHWSRYLPINFNYKGFLRRSLTAMVVKEASTLFTVSPMLRDAMRHNGIIHNDFALIDNVVDDFFYLGERQVPDSGSPCRFIHVSCFAEKAKNTQGLLRAVSLLRAQRNDFSVTMLGNGPDKANSEAYAKKLGLDDCVHFVGMKRPDEVRNEMYAHNCLVMFSNYETAGIIFSEAWATGMPVVSTSVGIIPNSLTECNGRVVTDEQSLADTMSWMIDNVATFSPEVIRQSARRFSFDSVGRSLMEAYSKALQHL